MNCNFDNSAMQCPRCLFKAGGRDWRRNCPLGTGQPAPGAHLHILLQPMLEELKIKPRSNCGCAAYARLMDSWGVAKCRERKAEIVEHLIAELGVKSTELPFGLDLRDLLGELVEEACRRAEASESSPDGS